MTDVLPFLKQEDTTDGGSGGSDSNHDHEEDIDDVISTDEDSEENEVRRADDTQTDMAGKFHPPDSFNFSNPTQWPQWKQRYERYTIVAKLGNEEPVIQVSTLLYCMGPEAEQIYNNFTFDSDTDRDDPTKVMEQFDRHFIPKRNVIFERAKFNQRQQEEGESIEAYVRVLYELAEHCDFAGLKDNFIRDRLVIGLRDKATSQMLQLEGNLTLKTAIETCRNREMVRSQNHELESPTSADAVFKKHHGKGKSQGKKSEICYKCGYEARRSHSSGKCPAKDAKCRKCNKTGHFQKCCKETYSKAKTNATVTAYKSDDCFMGAVKERNKVDRDAPWYAALSVMNSKIKFKIDTGADVSIISEKQYEQMCTKPKILQSDTDLNSVSGKIELRGYFDANLARLDENVNV